MSTTGCSCLAALIARQPTLWTTAAQRRRPPMTPPPTAMSPSQSKIPLNESRNSASYAKWTFIPTTRTCDYCRNSRVRTRVASTAVTSPDCARSNRNAWSARSIAANALVIWPAITKQSSSCRTQSFSIRSDRCDRIIIRSAVCYINSSAIVDANKCVYI